MKLFDDIAGGGSPIASREIIDVAADTIPPQTDPDEIEQFLVYMSLKADSLLLASNDTLQGFVDTYEQEHLGILSEIERLSAEGDYASAGQLLSNFIPETNIQNTYKSFYDLYISVKQSDDSITEYQLSQLQTLALQCPFADGEAVYKARAFYALLSNESLTYNDDNCITFGFSRSSIPDTNSTLIGNLVIEESKKIERAANKQFRIYPNPSSDFVFVSSSTGFSQSTFILRDISGRVLRTMQIPEGVIRIKIPLTLDNGIYFGTVSDNKGNTMTKRIVVQK